MLASSMMRVWVYAQVAAVPFRAIRFMLGDLRNLAVDVVRWRGLALPRSDQRRLEYSRRSRRIAAQEHAAAQFSGQCAHTHILRIFSADVAPVRGRVGHR